MAAALLLTCTLILQQRLALSFAPTSASPLSISQHDYNTVVSGIRPRQRMTCIHATVFTSAAASNAKQSIQETSDQLLRILQYKASATTTDGSKSKADDLAELDDQINPLVRTLIGSRTSFNPTTCIDGPLFASVHFIGDTPLWEKIASAAGVRNVKGQKYTLDKEDDGSSSGGGGTFVNYAEVLGGNFYLKAVGNCKDEGPVVDESIIADAEEEHPLSGGPLGALTSLFNSNKPKQQSTELLPTPYDYSATVTGASIVLFQKYSLDLTIEGTGTVRVLYADENLRIFLSPTDTNVTKGGGDWESKGLVVVQVRVDLVYDDWVDQL